MGAFIVTVIILIVIIKWVKKNKEKQVDETEDLPIKQKGNHKSSNLTVGIILCFFVVMGFLSNRFNNNNRSNNLNAESRMGNEKKILKSEVWFEYNDKGFLICKKYDSGSEERYEYDGRGNEIHTKSYVNIGEKIVCDDFFFEYDKHNNIVHVSHPLGKSETWRKYEYDKNGNMIKKNRIIL